MILLRFCGKDSSTEFDKFHSESVLKSLGEGLKIGVLEGAAVTEGGEAIEVDEEEEGDGSYFGDLLPFAGELPVSSLF